MRCKDCIYWVEKWEDREEVSSCHLEQKTVRKSGDDFCSHFTSNNKGGDINDKQRNKNLQYDTGYKNRKTCR